MSFGRKFKIALFLAISAGVSYEIFEGGMPSWPIGWAVGVVIYTLLFFIGYETIFERRPVSWIPWRSWWGRDADEDVSFGGGRD